MILTAANAITAFRLGLLAWFVVLVGEERLPLAALVFFIGWVLDAVDGFLARRLRQTSEVGSLFDKAADRLVLGGTFLTLLAYGEASAWAILLLSKDVSMLLVFLLIPLAKRKLDLGWGGKAATFLQGIALLWIMLRWPYEEVVIVIAAGLGVGVALRYWWSTTKGT